MSKAFKYDAFLIHSTRDKEVVETLARRLRDDGLKIWFDSWCIGPGDNIPQKIDHGLEASRCAVVLMSNAAFESDWARIESYSVFHRDPANTHRRFVTAILDDCKDCIPVTLRAYRYVDLSHFSTAEYELLRDTLRGGEVADSDVTPIAAKHRKGISQLIATKEVKASTTDLSTDALPAFPPPSHLNMSALPEMTRETKSYLPFFDARPDSLDPRDTIYRSRLQSIPVEFPSKGDVDRIYSEFDMAGLVLNQGQEGASVAFALAGVLNYKRWRRQSSSNEAVPPEGVSIRMLFNVGRLYADFPAHDYTGNSCRSLLKGVFKYGICSERFWPYRDINGTTRFVKPRPGWLQDAANIPIRNYQRIRCECIDDLRDAIREYDAILATGRIHEGWIGRALFRSQVIPFTPGILGIHAFAIVGYDAKEFIILNSSGSNWANRGFAILSYQDWLANGIDAWTLEIGAPTEAVIGGPMSVRTGKMDIIGNSGLQPHRRRQLPFSFKSKLSTPLPKEATYEHTIVAGHHGYVMLRSPDYDSFKDALNDIVCERPEAWLRERNATKIAIYCVSGFHDEGTALQRVQVSAPYFLANDIYPIFFAWQFGEANIIKNSLLQEEAVVLKQAEHAVSPPWFAQLVKRQSEAKDLRFETACAGGAAFATWGQMQRDVEDQAKRGGGLWLLAHMLQSLKAALPALEVHLIGHSSGAYLLGHLLHRMHDSGELTAASLNLLAPACSVEFANRHFRRALDDRTISRESLFFEILSDELERIDTFAAYSKSFLYLVSRALEKQCVMPLLGLEESWTAPEKYNGNQPKQVMMWLAALKGNTNVLIHDRESRLIFDGVEYYNFSHHLFDRDIDVLTRVLRRIRGGPLRVAVENLS